MNCTVECLGVKRPPSRPQPKPGMFRGSEKGLATNRAPNTAKIVPQNCVPLLLRGDRISGAGTGMIFL